MIMQTKQRGEASGAGLLSGVLMGVVLSVLYIKFDFALPAWLQPAETVEGLAITAAATMLTDENQADELQREIAVRIQAQPDYFVRIDNELGRFISEEVVWRESTKRDLKLLQDMVKAMAEQAERQPQPLADSLQRVAFRSGGRYVGLSTAAKIEEAIFGPLAATVGVQ